MAWLHTWSGLVCGWLLCAIFLTGSLSVFRDPITRWMEAEPLATAATSAAVGERSLSEAERYFHQHAAGARFWRVQLPQRPGEPLQLAWRDGATLRQAFLAADSGALLPGPQRRQTEGGRHFMSFHYMLQLPVLGFWLVGWLTLGLLVALVSGVVIHRRIFLDFFTFRPGVGPRAWLDAHNVTAVMTLPFLLMIAYTGLAIFPSSYLPWPMQAVYGFSDQAASRFQDELGERQAPDRVPLPNTPNEPPSWAMQLHRAQALTGQTAHLLLIERPATPAMKLRVLGRVAVSPASQTLFTPQASVLFDGFTGSVLQVQHGQPDTLSIGDQVQGVIKSLHFADFGGWAMKWVYFICGLLGLLMMASGTLLFAMKRRIKSQREFATATAAFYRGVEACNVACIAGIGVACGAYFYANRLLPLALAERAQWEIRCFLLVWLATLAHALLRAPAKAWTEQLGLAAALCLGLPLLNRWTTGQDIGRYLQAGDWQRASVEGVALAFGLLLMAVLVKRRQAGVR